MVISSIYIYALLSALNLNLIPVPRFVVTITNLMSLPQCLMKQICSVYIDLLNFDRYGGTFLALMLCSVE